MTNSKLNTKSIVPIKNGELTRVSNIIKITEKLLTHIQHVLAVSQGQKNYTRSLPTGVPDHQQDREEPDFVKKARVHTEIEKNIKNTCLMCT